MTNISIGNHAAIAPVDEKARTPSAQVPWNTSVIRPYAAPTERTLSATVATASHGEPNEIVMTRSVSTSTKATTHGSRSSIQALRSVAAACPPTWTSAPGTSTSAASTWGTSVSRMSATTPGSRSSEASIAMPTGRTVAVPSSETTASGATPETWGRVPASSRTPSRAARTSAWRSPGASTAIVTAVASPGTAVSSWREAWAAAQAERVHPVAEHRQQRRERRGGRDDGGEDDEHRAEGQAREQATRDEHAGHGDDDRDAGDDDGSPGSRPGQGDRVADVGARRAFLAGPADDEQGVVDADRQADEENEALRVGVHREDAVGRRRREPQRDADAAETEDEGYPGGDDRTEGDEEDGERQRDADELGPLEVGAEGGVDLLRHRTVADLTDRELGVRRCEGRGRLETRSDGLARRRCGGALGGVVLRVEGEGEHDTAAVGAGLRLADVRDAFDVAVCRRQLGADRGHLGIRERAVLGGGDDRLGGGAG